MSALVYFMAFVAVGIFSFFLLRRRALQRFASGPLEPERPSQSPDWDPLISELGHRIFDSRDLQLVRIRCSRQVAKNFHLQRTALALEWLRLLRKQVNHLMREHLRSARSDSNLKPAEELHSAFEFLLFQFVCGISYASIWCFGPPAVLARCPLQLTRKLQKLADSILPHGNPVAAELMKMDPQVKNRAGTP